jgi:hypothetical protein
MDLIFNFILCKIYYFSYLSEIQEKRFKIKGSWVFYPVGEKTPAKTSQAKNVLETKLSTIYTRSPYK